MKTTVLYLAFTFLLALSGRGQGWRIAPTVGFNVASISYSSAVRTSMNASGYNTDVGPLVRGQLGALIDYRFSDRFSIRSGLIYAPRGSRLFMTSSRYGITESARGSYKFEYVDIPLLLNFAVGHTNWRIMVGGVASALMSAKGSVDNGGSFSNYGYYQGTYTFYLSANQVRTFDFGATIGLTKELFIGDQPFEVSLNVQNAITKWNTSAKTNPELYARHSLVGLRAAYFFGLGR